FNLGHGRDFVVKKGGVPAPTESKKCLVWKPGGRLAVERTQEVLPSWFPGFPDLETKLFWLLAAMEKLSSSNHLVMPHSSRPVFAQGPSFQALEIEEPVDVYLFRPLGFVMARSAGTLGVTPNQLTILGMIVGAIGGALLYKEQFALLGVALLFSH